MKIVLVFIIGLLCLTTVKSNPAADDTDHHHSTDHSTETSTGNNTTLLLCDAGSVPRRGVCTFCPPGTYALASVQRCVNCPTWFWSPVNSVSPDACYPMTAAEHDEHGDAGSTPQDEAGFPLKLIVEYAPQVGVDCKRRFKKVQRFWSDTEVISSVIELLVKFAATLPKLTTDDFTVFNAIATTDCGHYWSNYNYWVFKDADLSVILAKLASVFQTPVSPEQITCLVAQIQACDEGAVVHEISSDSINVNNKDGWKIYAQFFAATCSKTSEKNQIFAWAASKQGEYLPGQYSESNAETIAKTIHNWLMSHLSMMVTCTNSPVQPMRIWGGSEASINEPYTESSSS